MSLQSSKSKEKDTGNSVSFGLTTIPEKRMELVIIKHVQEKEVIRSS